MATRAFLLAMPNNGNAWDILSGEEKGILGKPIVTQCTV